jgi:hypothetical protein
MNLEALPAPLHAQGYYSSLKVPFVSYLVWKFFKFIGWVVNLAQPIAVHFLFWGCKCINQIAGFWQRASGVSKLRILGFIRMRCLIPSEKNTGQTEGWFRPQLDNNFPCISQCFRKCHMWLFWHL